MATISEDEVAIKFVVETKDLDSRLSEVNKKLDDIGSNAVKSSETASSGFSNFGKSAIVLNQALGLVNAAVTGLNTVFTLLVSSLDEAGKVDALTRSFETLQNSVGNDATEALNKLRNATQGLVSDLDLIQASNRAVQLGLPTEGFELASASAIKLGRAMGIDATQAINDFTTGVGRGSVQILDNLGIIVKAEQAYQQFAEANNKTADSLTETEKKLAFQQAAYEAVIESAKNTADINLNAADSYDQLGNVIDNIKNQILIAIVNNEDLAEAFEDIKEVVESINWDIVINGISEVISFVGDLVSIVFNTIDVLIDVSAVFYDTVEPALDAILLPIEKVIEGWQRIAYGYQQLANLFRQQVFGDSVIESIKLADSLDNLGGKLKSTNLLIQNIQTQADFSKAQKQITDLAKIVNQSDKTFNLYGKSVESLQLELAKIDQSTLKASRSTKDFEGRSKDAERALREAEKAAKKYQEQIDNLDDVLRGTTEKTLFKFEQGLADLGVTGVESLRANADAVKEFAIDFAKLNDIDLDTLTKTTEDFARDYDKIMSDLREEELRKQKAFNQELNNVAARGVEDALRNVFNGGSSEDYREVSQQAAGDVAALFLKEYGPVAEAAGRVIAEEIVGSLFDAFGGRTNAAANLRADLSAFLNDAIKDIKFKSDILFEGEFKIPRGRDAFDPITSELTGELTTAAEIALKNLQIPPELVNTFNDIGTALALALGEGQDGLDEVINQFGTLLALNFQNVQGLNELQIILQSAGLSAEQLGEALETAFLNGDIGAGQFLSSLAQVEDLFTQGIPAAIGATDIAFDNLGNALESGRVGFDALGDIAAEAAEKGIKSFDELRSDLINSGKSVKDVDLLFQSLATNGIGSIEELQNITVRQTAGVINSLEQSGFAFNKVTENVEQLRAELDEIKSKEIDIRLNVSTNYDNNTQELLRNPATAQVVPALGNA